MIIGEGGALLYYICRKNCQIFDRKKQNDENIVIFGNKIILTGGSSKIE